MPHPIATKPGRLLYGLVVLVLVFMAIAALAVAGSLLIASVVPDGAFSLIGGSAAHNPDVALMATGGRRIAIGAVTLENLVVTAIVLVTLLKILRSTTRGTPFVFANVGRLRLIAAAYAVSLVARFTVPLLVPAPIADWLASAHWSFNFGDGGALLVALVLAEVFREGVRLREDHDATV